MSSLSILTRVDGQLQMRLVSGISVTLMQVWVTERINQRPDYQGDIS